MATVYSDRGFGVRAPVVFYNSANEAAALLKPGDFDWEVIFAGGESHRSGDLLRFELPGEAVEPVGWTRQCLEMAQPPSSTPAPFSGCSTRWVRGM